jgi:hypothetical protein
VKTLSIHTYSLALRLLENSMKQLCLKKLWVFLFMTCAFSIPSFSQTVTGIWRGYFIDDYGNNYKLEFQVKQDKIYAVTGVSYSYLDVRFYGKATMTGSFTKSSNTFRIREIRTVEVKQQGFGSVCIMNYDLKYSRSGKEEFLQGTYLGKYEIKDDDGIGNDWGSCGGGKVFLRKVTTSDFYIEPFLRKGNPTVKPRVNVPPSNQNKPVTPVPQPPAIKKSTTKPPVTDKKIVQTDKPKEKIVAPADTLIAKPNDIKKTVPVNIPVTTPDVLKSRQNELMKSLVVNDPDVTVKLFDNGEVDDDTISVYLDKKLVLSKRRLTASPLTLRLKMDDENPEHELVMVAENLGRIPPNTSLMIVEAGEQRFEVRITSNTQKNALVRFRYEKGN